MENFCRGACWGMIAGLVIGGIIVAKNRKLANKIKEGLWNAENKIEEVKEGIAEKLQESDCCFSGDCSNPKDQKNHTKK